MRIARGRFVLFAGLILLAVTGPSAPRGGGAGCSSATRAVGKAPVGRIPKVVPKPVRPMPTPRPVTWRMPAPLVIGLAAPTPPRLAARFASLRDHLTRGEWLLVAGLARTLSTDAELTATARASLASLSQRCEAIDALRQVRAVIVKPSLAASDFEVAEAALAKVPPSDRTGTIRRYLGCRARLEGQPAAANRLGAAGDGKGVVRDLKNVADADVGTRSADAPLGLPVPEGPAIGPRPDVQEALGAGLADEALLAEKPARTKATALIENEAAFHAAHARLLMQQWSRDRGEERQGKAGPPPPAEAKRGAEPEVDEVAKLLGREVTPVDRMLIRHLRARKSADETAALLAKEGKR